jgi:hypothetical protein
LGLAREYRKLQPGVKPFSLSAIRRSLHFSTFEAQALPMSVQPWTHDCVDRPWFADLWWGRFL